MANKRYIVTRSNYILKQKHQSLKNGDTVYVRDFMATTNLGGYDSGSIPYENSNFKFVHNINDNDKRSINNGHWLVNESGSTKWTLNSLSSNKPKEESQVVIKPNKNSFKDFVYFGSCVDLINVSVQNIINKFPAELYISNEPYNYAKNKTTVETLGSNVFDNPVQVFNPFNIDITSTLVNSEEKERFGYNELRYFSESLNKYDLINDTGETTCLTNRTVITKQKKCYRDGDLMNIVKIAYDSDLLEIYVYYFSTGNILIADGDKFNGYHIRPRKEYVDESFESMSVFEKFLLNQDSKPLYTINIDVPEDTDEGLLIVRKSYTWNTQFDWNIDIVSGDYSKYIRDLLYVAEKYDEHYTNNLWENIVHESIKNMDLTFTNPSKDEDIDDYRLGIGNIKGFLLAYARLFDDIKLSIENTKSVNVVTYDENNNIPDYLLSDSLELSGWEVSSAVKTLDETVTVSNLFPGENKKYNADELNTIFLRNLRINAKDIFKRKGNRQGIEMILALFGMSSYEYGKNYYNCLPETYKIIEGGITLDWDDLSDEQKSIFYDYKLDEYVAVAKNTAEDIVPEDEDLPIEVINQNIKGDSVLTVAHDEYDNEYENINSLVGLPVRMVYLQDDSGTTKYLIPWFDKTVKYDGKTYFQMYGGWTEVEHLDDYTEYTETLKYLNILPTIGSLSEIPYYKLNNGDIYYVEDITDWRDYYPEHSQSITLSHYFYLNNVDKCYEYSDDGWQIIPDNDVKNKQGHGVQVYHLENIINEYRGNNPHVGFGKYDSGRKYLERLRHVFDGAIDDGLFDGTQYVCETGELDDEVKNAGFTVDENIVDNVKCWYFTDTTKVNKLIPLTKKYIEVTDTQGDSYEIPAGYKEDTTANSTIYVGKKAKQHKDVFVDTELNAFNFETQEEGSNDEAAANSIINVKNITIEFNKFKYGESVDFDNYLHEVILKYLEQVIPTTTMLTIKYIGADIFDACQDTPVITGVSD